MKSNKIQSAIRLINAVQLMEQEHKQCDMEELRIAVNKSCICGGRGPNDNACPACMVWHYMTKTTQ